MKISTGLILILIFVLSFSCIKDAPEDFNNPESTWNPSFSFPIGITSLGMDENSGFDTLLFQIDSLSGYPLWVNEVDIPLNYIMPFNMQDLNSFSEQILSILIRLNTYNGFPTDAMGQVYFLDSNNFVVDSVFVNDPLELNPGTPTGNGETINPSYNQSNIFFDQDKIDELANVKNIFIEGLVNNLSLDTALIDFYPDYKLDIQIGVQVELNMSISSK